MKKGKCCDPEFQPSRTTQQVCSPRCALELLQLKKDQKKKREIKEAKKKLKSRSDFIRECQSSFNRYIKQRDAALTCVSCNRNHQGQWHAGHYRSTGSAGNLRFGDPSNPEQLELSEANCWKQCAPCNTYLSGNAIPYRQTLVKRIGEELLEKLENYNEQHKWTIEELEEIKKYYNKKYRSLL
jgi:hypothetical protein